MTETGKMTPDLSVKIAGVELKNPVMTCSGTFGSGEEYSEFVDLNGLGAVVTKGIASEPWNGNPTPRVCEVTGGMLNAIGLQGPGIDVFVKRDIPFLRQYDTKIIVNICGHTIEDYIDVTERLADQPVDMLEINISCPNVHEGGKAFGQDPAMVQKVTEAVKRVAKQPVIMKLTPNVTDITEIARAAEAGGADALSLINTLTGMKIDIHRRSFVLANKTGGMSGPAIKPVAVRMVYQTARAVKVPVIGMGGIACADELSGALTCNLGILRYDGNEISAHLDCRYPLCGDEAKMLGSAVKTVAPAGMSVKLIGSHAPLHVPADHKVVKGLLKVYHEVTGLEPYTIAIGGGTYSRMMPNTVAFGVCFPGDMDVCHIADEYIDLEKLMLGVKIFAHAIAEIAGGQIED